jgi:multimeric flavodoxin WrbA
MKVLGLTFGRKLGNTEILVKEALMGAEEAGAAVELIRVPELDIKACTGCNACVVDLFEKAGSGKCVLKDDFAWIDDKILEADGLVIGSPIYEKSPTGLYKTLNDRMGPSHDMAFRIIAQRIHEEKRVGSGPDPRSFKPRVCSLFAVGGSDWVEFGLPLMQVLPMPMQITVVDQHVFNWIALPGVVSLKPEMLARARKSGAHVVASLGLPPEKAEYIGDEGMCPICHSKLLEVSGSLDKVRCGTCGVQGSLRAEGSAEGSAEGGSARFIVTEEAAALSHWRVSGKFRHGDDLNNISLKPPANMGEVAGKLAAYKDYLSYSKPAR